MLPVGGIFSTPYYLSNSSQNIQQNNNGFQQNFAQLGQDLQAGNLSAAEQDFASLQSVNPQLESSNIGSSTTGSTTSTQGKNPITQAFQQLSVDLQSGNLSGAQQAYSNIEQDAQTQGQSSQSGQTEGHHHHHHGGGGENPINQLFPLDPTASSSSSPSPQQQPYSFLTQLPYAQPLGQDSSSISSLSLTA